MIERWPKFVAVLIAVMFTGATHACLCAGMGEKIAAPTPADPHACCKRTGEESPALPASDDPCKTCNAQHPLTITVPEKSSVAPTPDFLVAALLPVELPFTQIVVGFPADSGTADVPIPPLLRDLVHTSCQLTV